MRGPNMREGFVERFWDKVAVRGEHECWAWLGTHNKRWYGEVLWRGRCTKAYCVAWELFTGTPPPSRGMDLDHVCGNSHCVNPHHLRLCSHQQNVWNSRTRVDNSTGFKCVSRAKSGKFFSHIRVNGVRRHLGTFSTPEEAHEAYVREAIKEFGEFANRGDYGGI